MNPFILVLSFFFGSNILVLSKDAEMFNCLETGYGSEIEKLEVKGRGIKLM